MSVDWLWNFCSLFRSNFDHEEKICKLVGSVIIQYYLQVCLRAQHSVYHTGHKQLQTLETVCKDLVYV